MWEMGLHWQLTKEFCVNFASFYIASLCFLVTEKIKKIQLQVDRKGTRHPSNDSSVSFIYSTKFYFSSSLPTHLKIWAKYLSSHYQLQPNRGCSKSQNKRLELSNKNKGKKIHLFSIRANHIGAQHVSLDRDSVEGYLANRVGLLCHRAPIRARVHDIRS